ncbi:hypothetical protein IWX81_001211 [Salinibacterium sp. CAN_S4]|uniref:DUF4245 domain-containing protein n=1 Tax=Salinibacterium sp. CAN_S4 TaxID=2787727 RepID=UPI0018F05304
MAQKEPAIVAELGRPETPDETAARKAENSRKHRANQTALNLVGATIASLAIVAFLIIVVVRPAPAPAESIDYVTVASQAQVNSEEPLLAPALPPSWTANAARFESREQVPTWYIGFVTPDTQFIALNQGIDANPTWEAAVLNNSTETGSIDIDGVTWTEYDQRDSSSPGNFAYSLATTSGGSTIVLHGTAEQSEFEALATALAAELTQQ